MISKNKLKAGDNLELKNGEAIKIISVDNHTCTVEREDGEKRVFDFEHFVIVKIESKFRTNLRW